MNVTLAECETLISHAAGDAETTVGYTGLEFKEEVRSTNMKCKAISMQMTAKTTTQMKLDEVHGLSPGLYSHSGVMEMRKTQQRWRKVNLWSRKKTKTRVVLETKSGYLKTEV